MDTSSTCPLSSDFIRGFKWKAINSGFSLNLFVIRMHSRALSCYSSPLQQPYCHKFNDFCVRRKENLAFYDSGGQTGE